MFEKFSLHVQFFCYWLLHASDKLEVKIYTHFSSSNNYSMPKCLATNEEMIEKVI